MTNRKSTKREKGGRRIRKQGSREKFSGSIPGFLASDFSRLIPTDKIESGADLPRT